MPIRKAPIRGPRALYKLDLITRPVDDNPTGIDPATGTGGTTQPLYVRMKEPIGDWFGLKPIAWDDPILIRTFDATPKQTGATNAGAKYYGKKGGYRAGSFKLVAKTVFNIGEIVLGDNGYSTVQSQFRAFSIGFPTGYTVHEFLSWLKTTSRITQIRSVVTPHGRTIHIGSAT